MIAAPLPPCSTTLHLTSVPESFRLWQQRRIVRRSTPKKTIDDRTFPIRIRVIVPEGGFGKLVEVMDEWLRETAHAWHGGGWGQVSGRTRQTCFVYFESIDDAYGFLKRFSEIELCIGDR